MAIGTAAERRAMLTFGDGVVNHLLPNVDNIWSQLDRLTALGLYYAAEGVSAGTICGTIRVYSMGGTLAVSSMAGTIGIGSMDGEMSVDSMDGTVSIKSMPGTISIQKCE